jgi:transcriptional regulator with XRE-family HTH domain
VDTEPTSGVNPAMSDILVTFGSRLRELRTKQGLSQEAFADHCGLDRTYISGIERGRRNPSLRNLVKIARSLDLSLSEMLRNVR